MIYLPEGSGYLDVALRHGERTVIGNGDRIVPVIGYLPFVEPHTRGG